jgi:hypothetical protein
VLYLDYLLQKEEGYMGGGGTKSPRLLEHFRKSPQQFNKIIKTLTSKQKVYLRISKNFETGTVTVWVEWRLKFSTEGKRLRILPHPYMKKNLR